MKYILILILLVSCGTNYLRNDSSTTNDADARYESVFTQLGKNATMGNAVYQVKNKEDLIEVHTLLSGTYEIRSNSCNYQDFGTYRNNESIFVPISDLFSGEETEKLCSITIQLNPELRNSEVAIFPRYSIIYVQLTNRDEIKTANFQFPRLFSAGELINIGIVDKYRLIQNCVGTSPTIIKESLEPQVAKVYFSELNQKEISSCYYSLVYDKGDLKGRYSMAVNVYNENHIPLTASIKKTSKKVYVNSPDTVSICAIGFMSKYRNNCSEKLRRLPEAYVIQVHTNKRSFFKMEYK